MQFSEDLVKNYQKEMKENHNEEVSDDQAQDHLHRMADLVKLLWEISQKSAARDRRLKDEPNGFALES